MNPRNTIFVSITAFVLTIASAGVSVLHAYAASQPIGSGTVLGASTDASITTDSSIPALSKYPVATSAYKPSFAAREYELYDPASGKTLVSSANMTPVPIASTTKLMTTYLAVKYGNPTDILTITPEAASINGSLMGIYKGEQISVQSLLYGALLVSGNDAAMSLGAYVGGILLHNPNASYADKVAREVQEMNTTAHSFGMENTAYKDPAGLNDDGHSTAFDLAKLFAIDIQQPLLRQIFGTGEITVSDVQGKTFDLRNSDHITSDFNYPGNIGGKTGFTPAAGHCLVSAATQNGITLIGVALASNDTGVLGSANAVKALLDYGFSNFTWQ